MQFDEIGIKYLPHFFGEKRLAAKCFQDFNPINQIWLAFAVHYGKIAGWNIWLNDKFDRRTRNSIRKFTVIFNVSAISRGIVYRQQPIIADQMKRNQEIRKEYQDKKMSSSADCIKRLSNSLFGKMLEDPRRREKISFVTQKKRYLKLANKANFMGRKIISQNCVLMKNKQTKIAFNKPLFIGKRKMFY